MSTWLRIAGRLPAGYEEPFADSAAQLARWLIHTHDPSTALNFANAPCFETWIFPHIPKTAGTALIEAMDAAETVAHVRIETLPISEARHRLEMFRKAARTRRIVLSGHVHLKYWDRYFRWTGREKIMTIVREPEDLHISCINFILGRIRNFLANPPEDADSLPARIDVWRQRYANGSFHDFADGECDSVAAWLAMVDAPFEVSKSWALSLIGSQPYKEIYRESLLFYMGYGDADVESTVRFLRRLRPVVVPIEHVDAFARETFGLTLARGVNARDLHVLDAADVDAGTLRDLVGRDREIYAGLIARAWRPSLRLAAE